MGKKDQNTYKYMFLQCNEFIFCVYYYYAMWLLESFGENPHEY